MLTIRIAKQKDGSSSLTCIRADGTRTWQKQSGGQGRFFPRHDITHFVVETVLGHRRGFYGLVADGWNLEDFGSPWPRGPLPPDMDPSELLVGFLDVERATVANSGALWSAAEFNEQAALYFLSRAPGKTPPVLTEAQLERIRRERAELFARWDAVPPGGELVLEFAPGRVR